MDGNEEEPEPTTPEEWRALGSHGRSPLTVEGYLESLGMFARGLKRRYPQAGRFIVAAILIAFILGWIELDPFH